MIDTLRVQNFKALRDVEVPLRPFTVLIGPNDSGKSSILQALEFFGHFQGLLGHGLHQGQRDFCHLFGPEPDRVVHQRDPKRRVTLGAEGVTGSSQHFRYDITLRARKNALDIREETAEFRNTSVLASRWQGDEERGELRSVDPDTLSGLNISPAVNMPSICSTYQHAQSAEIIEALSSAMIRFRPEALAEPCELRNLGEAMDTDGHGLAAILDALITGPNRRAIFELEEQLHKLVPSIRGVSLVTTDIDTPQGLRAGKALELVLTQQRDGHDVTIPATHTSQGTLLALGYLALVYSRTARCLLIEEPENGLHPSALGFVVDLLKKVSRGEVGPGPRQVVLTTHSPLLLNFVEPEDVLIVTRTEDNVRVTPMVDTPHFAERFEDFDLGELWYNVGEDDLIKEP